MASAQDFPTYKGDNARTGKNSDPNNSNPGPALLTWFRPNAADNAGKTLLVDNGDQPDPNTDPAYVTTSGTWVQPAVADEALNPFLPDTNNPPTGVLRPANVPGYEYAEAVASATGTDPRVPLNPGTLSVFTWTLRNYTAPFNEARDYAVYVWLPVGPTTIGGAERLPQRYFVYEVIAPGSPVWVEVLDTEFVGGGWVRLGSGGNPTTRLFSSDGTGPIQVRLYNTVPRDPATGRLTTNPDPNILNQDLDPSLPLPLVYADAVMAVPHIGSYAATPIVSSFTGPSGADTRTIGVLNQHQPGGRGVTTTLDNTSAGVTPGMGWAASSTAPGFIGTDYLTNTITNTLGNETVVTYTPVGLANGDYEVYAWLPGSGNGVDFGTAVEYRIFEGATQTNIAVNQASGGAWVRLGGTRFTHSNAPGEGLSVRVTNYSALPGDIGLAAMADAISFSTGDSFATVKGVVTSYSHGTGVTRWRFSPLEEGEEAFNMDNQSAGVTLTGSAWISSTATPNFRGSDHLEAPVVNDPSDVNYSTVEYEPGSPSLEDGLYDIFVWLPGGLNLPQALRYEVHEGENVELVTVNQQPASGWLRIGARRYSHTAAASLRLAVTNYSTDVGDAGTTAFTDAVRFVGASSLAIASTPVQMNARVRLTRGGSPEERGVVLVAAENGRIYCLDAEGRGDGSTDVLWTYPSLPDPDLGSSWRDGNLYPPEPGNLDWAEIDGTNGQRIAEMPTSFNLSSAAIERINGEDYLFIGASNGRVYCIEVAGRGDMNFAARKPGTTRRIWSYPDDFPATVIKPSNLGAFIGSVAVATTTDGPTVFVPAAQGRLFALDAAGDNITRTTTERWTYPLLTEPTLGPISTTPAIEFGRVYLGTSSKDFASPGRFIALNADTGAFDWELSGTAQPLDDFGGSPTTVSAALLNVLGGAMPDTVFVANDNRGVYALDAATGAIQWETTELEAPARAPLTYTFMSVIDNTQVANDRPVIVVPRSDGVVSILSARTTDTTLTGNRRARGDFITESVSLTASVAVGHGFMYYADNAGFLYARSSTAGSHAPGEEPGREGVGENDPDYDIFKGARFKFIQRSAYNLLRQGSMYYQDAMDPGIDLVRNPMAYEWGETIYLLIYNFAYKPSGMSRTPTINVSFSLQGATVRNIFVQSSKFPGVAAGTPVADTDNRSGYAIVSFPIQGAGANALPPGEGQISLTFNTTRPSTGAPVSMPAIFKQPFFIANPLALIIPGPLGPQQIGNTNDPSDPQNLTNGSAVVPNLRSSAGTIAHGQTGNTQLDVIDRSLMTLQRGGRGIGNVRVWRLDLGWQLPAAPLGPSQGAGLVRKPFDSALFPNFEDLPVNFPNDSLDYPDIRRERVRITKSLLEASENPVSFHVELLGPRQADGSIVTEATAADRVFQLTPFDFDVDVPRFQPPNESRHPDANSAGDSANYVPAGYGTVYTVYVDTTGNGVFDRGVGWNFAGDGVNPSNSREAYRTFFFGASVAPDERLAVTTPTVDLGSLASGTGYTPEPPILPGGGLNPLFSPWAGAFKPLFRSFNVVNQGNVNMLNLRLAKSETYDGASFDEWKIFSPANEDLSYLSGEWDLWSDLDPAYAPTREIAPGGDADLNLLPNLAPVILQKARVGDRSPTSLSPNPVRRPNPNLAVATDEPLITTLDGGGNLAYPPARPRIAVTLPLGFPVGTYSGLVRIFEDNAPGDNAAAMARDLSDNGTPGDPSDDFAIEPNSDPTLRVLFRAVESRLTGSHSLFTAPMIDPLSPDTAPFRRSNRQPAGFRAPGRPDIDSNNGSLVVAWASDRTSWANLQEPTPITNPQYRLYVGSVGGGNPEALPGTYPLRDLHQFIPDAAGDAWFTLSPETANGFPTDPLDQVFDVDASQSVVAATARFGSPSFPVSGLLNPYRDVAAVTPEEPFNFALMGFVGSAQIQTPSGRLGHSKIFLAPVAVGPDGTVTMGEVQAMTNDPLAAKGRPSVLQTDTGAIVFYSATLGGRNSIYWTHFDGDASTARFDGSGFSESVALELGQGFESLYSPQATGRLYLGQDAAAGGDPIIELTFGGKLRSRPNPEVFYARMTVVDDGGTLIPGELATLPERRERLTRAGEAGTFRADGVLWAGSNPVLQLLRGGVLTDIRHPNSPISIERTTGIMTFQTRLGGTAYLDPSMGTVRLANANVPRDGELILTYTPRVLRVSESTAAGFVSPNIAFDERLIPDVGYWSAPDNVTAPTFVDQVRAGRWVFVYNRAAAGSGQAARPFMKTMRLGVELDYPIFTNPDGTVPDTGFEVFLAGTSNPINGYYQMDPAKGKVYFTPEDENVLVDIFYTAADPGTGASLGDKELRNVRVGMIAERPEGAVPLNEAVNEMNIWMFLDPFERTDGTGEARRPGMIWLLWSSTRNGAPDLFFQSVAPRFTPLHEAALP